MTDANEEKTPRNHRFRKIILFSIGVITIALGIFLWWFFYLRFIDSTNDAYVHGNQVRVSSQVPGIIASVNTENTLLVEEGQVLACLDETDMKIALEKAKAELADTIRKVTEMFEEVYVIASRYQEKQAEVFSKEVDYLDRKQIVDTGAISDEEFVHSEAAYMAACFALKAIKYDLMQAISRVQYVTVKTHPLVEKAKEAVRQAYVNLARCKIKAPQTGIVAQRSMQVGQTVLPTTPLLSVIPLDQMWIEANFKEVQLRKLRLGQRVEMTADTYGRSVVFTGEVIGIDAGSGAVFSPLPPQNATGNWIKIVQRIPVRIKLNPEQLRKNPLRLGMSMNVHVDVKEMEGPMIPPPSLDRSIWSTNIYEEQQKGAEELIAKIMQENSTFDLAISNEIASLANN